VSVWDVQNKIPLVVKEPDRDVLNMVSLQFSSGTLRREVLAFVEVSQLFLGVIFFMLSKLLVEQERRYYPYSPH